MRQGVVVTVLLAVAMFLAGCGSSPDQKVAQAEIAIRNHKFDIALKLAEDVLKKQPDRFEALMIKAEAQMGLGRYDDARGSISAASNAKPSEKEPHLLMINWSLVQLNKLVNTTEFLTDAKLNKQFDDVLATGMAEVQWLADPAKGKSTADAEYQNARLLGAEADRIRAQWAADNKLPVGDVDSKRDHDAKVEADRQKLDAKVDEIMTHLNLALKANPRHFEAATLYARLRTERRQWEYLWEMLQDQAKQEKLPGDVVEKEVVCLLIMPDVNHPEADRVELAKRLLAAVDPQNATSTPVKLTQARIALRPPHADVAKARDLLKEVVATDPGNVDARFILAQIYVYQATTPGEAKTAEESKNDLLEAKKILEPMAKEMTRVWDVQLLYGRALMELHQNDEAKLAIQNARDLLHAQDPQNRTADELWIRYLTQLNSLRDAAPDIEKILATDPADPTANRVKYDILRTNGSQQIPQFLEGLEKLKEPSDPILRLLVEGYLNLKDDKEEIQQGYYKKAEAYALQLEQKNENKLEYELLLAETRLAQGRFDEVNKALSQLSAKFPEDGSVNQLLGEVYLRRGMNDKAIELLRKATADEKGKVDTRVRSHLLLAEALSRVPLPDDAINEVKAALQIDPNDTAALAMGARIYDFVDNKSQAAEFLSRIDPSKLDEVSDAATLAQIKLYGETPDIEGAAEICRRAIAAANHDPALNIFLAQIYAYKKEYEKAAAQFSQIVVNQPKSPAAWQRWAGFYIANHRYDEGISAISAFENHDAALSRMAQAMIYLAWTDREDRFNQALRLIQPVFDAQLRQKNPDAALLGNMMARIILGKDRKDTDAAVKVFQQLIDAGIKPEEARLSQIDLTWNPTDSASTEASLSALDQLAARPKLSNEIRYELMRRYLQRNHVDRAIKVLDTWIASTPTEPTLHRWKGEFLLKLSETKDEQKNQTDGIKELQESVRLAPEDARLQRRLAEAYQAIYDFPAAEQTYREASKIDQGAKIVMTSDLGLMYVTLGLNQQARDTFATLNDLKDPRVSFALGRAYMALGDKEAAIKKLDKSQIPTFSPLYASAQVLLARIENRMGRKADARARIEALVGNDARNSPAAAMELLRLDYRSSDDRSIVEDTSRFIEATNLPDALRAQWLKLKLNFQDQKLDAAGALSTIETLERIPAEKETATVPAARIALLIKTKSEGAARREYDASGALQRSLLGPLAAVAVGAQPPAGSVDASAKPLPDWPLSNFIVAMALGKTEDAKTALSNQKLRDSWGFYRSDLLKAMEDRPGSKEVQAQYVRLCAVMLAMQSGLNHVAISMAEEVADQNPKLVLAHAMSVQARVNSGESLAPITKRVQKDLPDSALALFLDARDKMGTGNYKAAIADMQKLATIEPDNADTVYRLSQFQFGDGQYDAAIESLRKVVSIPNNPYIAPAKNDLAYSLAEHKTGNLEEAYKLATESLEAARKSATPTITVPALQDTLGWIEHKRGHDDIAQTLLAKAVFMLSDNAEVHYHMAEVYQARGNKEWAKYHYAVAATDPAGRPFAKKAKDALEGKGS